MNLFPTISVKRAPLYLTAFAVSFHSLFCEMLLTRLLGYKVFTHVVHLIIGISLLGYGIGASLPVLLRKKIDPTKGAWLILQPIAFIASTYALCALSPSHLNSSLTGHALLSYAIAIPPFIVAGYFVASVLSLSPKEEIGRIYFADLAGAALGVGAFFLVLPHAGLIGSLVLCSIFFVALFALITPQKRLAFGAVAALVALALLFPEERITIAIDRTKELGFADRAIPGEYTKVLSVWHPLAKVEAIEPYGVDAIERFAGVYPGTFFIPLEPRPGYRYFVVNGAAGTPAYELSDEGLDRRQSYLERFSTPMEFPYALTNRPRVFVIGTGGGRDIYSAIAHGAQSVTGAEINPVICSQMKHGDFAKYTGHIYTREGVTVHCDDGRRVARRALIDGEKFDLIVLNGIDTFTAVSNGSYTFAESFLYTQEAMDNYVRLLSSGGMINFNRWHFKDYPREGVRLVIQASHALRKLGVTDPAQHIMYVVYDMWAMVLIRRSPITPIEQERILSALAPHDVLLLHAPHQYRLRNPITEYLKETPQTDQAERAFIDAAPYEIGPVTDDAPFFFKYYRFRNIPEVFTTALFRDTTPLGGHQALFVQTVVTLYAVVFTFLFIVLPFLRRRPGRLEKIALPATYFVSIALGYVFLQIPLIQATSVLLGSPIYSLGTVLSCMLLGTGLGSWLSDRQAAGPSLAHLGENYLALLITLGGAALANELLIQALLPLPWIASLVFVALLAGHSGFRLGAFFPTGMRVWITSERESVAWAYAINSGGTVIAAFLSTILAQLIGFRLLMFTGLGLYGLAIYCASREPSPLGEPARAPFRRLAKLFPMKESEQSA